MKIKRYVTPLAVVGMAAALTLLPVGSAQAATVVEVTSFGSNPGNLQLFTYVPDNLPANAPLVVAMPGDFPLAAS
jgi:poly(3-hydroxybutyrate) depolymerase